MARCTWDAKCKNQATCVPKIYIPAKGHPAIAEQSMCMVAGVKMCRSCCKKINPKDFIPDLEKLGNVGAHMSHEHKGGHFNPVDVERAWAVPLDLLSDEYKNFERISQKRDIN